MENIAMLKQIVCLLSCQPRNMDQQLPGALDCLRRLLNVKAVGFYWPDSAGKLTLRMQHPADINLDAETLDAIFKTKEISHPEWGATKFSWLVTPMKVGGKALGRLWIVDEPGRAFSQDERELIMMTGNQLALAFENSRLYEEGQRLAYMRGELLRRVIATQDERCRRISRELHDEISQSLTAMTLDIEAVEIADRLSKDTAMRRLSNMRPRLQSALEEVNRIILDLRPTLLEDMGLLTALRWFAGQRLEPLHVQVHIMGDNLERAEPYLETTLYRIAQEALNNVAKHANASQVWLNLERQMGNIQLTIRDDGIGFDPVNVLDNPNDLSGIGIFGMQERAALVGGSLNIQSAPGHGTTIVVSIPTEVHDEVHPSLISG